MDGDPAKLAKPEQYLLEASSRANKSKACFDGIVGFVSDQLNSESEAAFRSYAGSQTI
jgi:hypothetical protein